MNRALLVLLVIVTVIGAENPGVAQLAANDIQLHNLERRMWAVNEIMQNPHMKSFYHQYYTRPQESQQLQINDLLLRANDYNTASATKPGYPFGGVRSMDPNVALRLARMEPNANMLRSVNTKRQQLEAADASYARAANSALAQRQHAIRSYASLETAKLRDSIMGLKDTLRASRIDSVPTHQYSAPFERDGNLDKVSQRIGEMERDVQAPLPPMMPNAAEIAAMNRLAAKMEEISAVVHRRGVEKLEQEAQSQDILLEQLAFLIRRFSNTVEENKRSQFLEQVHQLLHKYHLHDHKFLNTMENEIMAAVKENKPLAMMDDSVLSVPTPSQVTAPVSAVTNSAPVSAVTNSAPVAAVTNAAPVKAVSAPVSAVTGTITGAVSAPVSAATGAVSTATNTVAAPVKSVTAPVTNTVAAPVNSVTSTVTGAVSAPVSAATGAVSSATGAVTAPVSNAASSVTEQAMATSAGMKNYGENVIGQSKELAARADLLEKRAKASGGDEELLNAIMKRLNAPPAQVQVL